MIRILSPRLTLFFIFIWSHVFHLIWGHLISFPLSFSHFSNSILCNVHSSLYFHFYLLFSLNLIYLILSHFICLWIISPWWLHLITSNVHLSSPHLYYVWPPIQFFFNSHFQIISSHFFLIPVNHPIYHTVIFNLHPVNCLPHISVFPHVIYQLEYHESLLIIIFTSHISQTVSSHTLWCITLYSDDFSTPSHQAFTSHCLIFSLFSSFDPNTNTVYSHLISCISSCLICCHVNTLCCFPISTISSPCDVIPHLLMTSSWFFWFMSNINKSYFIIGHLTLTSSSQLRF